MSKLTKLLTAPRLFIRDAVVRVAAAQDSSGSRLSTPSVKPSSKTGEKKLDLSRANPLGNYSMILHCGEGADGISQLLQWIPAFLNTGVRFVVMIRTLGLYNALVRHYPKLDIVYISNATDVESFVLAHRSLRFVCYTSNTGNNIHLVRHNHLTHVFIGHGDSDKSASAHKVFRMYDEIWTAGKAHRDRFQNALFPISSLVFHEVGRPGINVALTVAGHSWQDRIRLGIRMLYLPTWEGYFAEQDYASLGLASDILMKTAREFPESRVSAKFHPFTGKRNVTYSTIRDGLELLARQEGLEERVRAVPSSVPVEDMIPDANLFVCDISAVVTDCLVADCPIFVYMPRDRPIALSQSSMCYEDYAYLFSTVDELHGEIRSVLERGDRLAEARSRAREYILGISAIERSDFLSHVTRLSSTAALT